MVVVFRVEAPFSSHQHGLHLRGMVCVKRKLWSCSASAYLASEYPKVAAGRTNRCVWVHTKRTGDDNGFRSQPFLLAKASPLHSCGCGRFLWISSCFRNSICDFVYKRGEVCYMPQYDLARFFIQGDFLAYRAIHRASGQA